MFLLYYQQVNDTSLIYQAFVRAREYQTSGKAAIIVISPLNSIYIKDQLKDMERQCFSSVDAFKHHYNYYNHYSLHAIITFNLAYSL